jgi:hypothetical protein
MRDPTAMLVAQNFTIRDKDVHYASTASGADLARFLSTVARITLLAIAIGNFIGSGSGTTTITP